jgi:hypothetical protein
MARRRHLAIFAFLACLWAAGGSSPAHAACGAGGYSYAGVRAGAPAHGISARLTALRKPNVQNGHVAAWVGVGGVGLGPGGSNEWLQAGIAAFPSGASELYFEVALPGRKPVFVTLRRNVPQGSSHVIAVVEDPSRPGAWQVRLDGRVASSSIFLPGSHGAWAPVATSETWDGGVPSCNSYMYRFDQVRLATTPGGGWTTLTGGVRLQDPGYRVLRESFGFVADGA